MENISTQVNVFYVVSITSVIITTIWAYKIVKKRNRSLDYSAIGFFFGWIGLFFLWLCLNPKNKQNEFINEKNKFKLSNSLIIIPAFTVTWVIIASAQSTSGLTTLAGLFVICSIWILSLGLIFDS